jgi:hypothetical protein
MVRMFLFFFSFCFATRCFCLINLHLIFHVWNQNSTCWVCMFITFVAVAVYSDIFCPLGAVFHVTDQQGNKIQEADVLEHIQKVNFF